VGQALGLGAGTKEWPVLSFCDVGKKRKSEGEPGILEENQEMGVGINVVAEIGTNIYVPEKKWGGWGLRRCFLTYVEGMIRK